MSDNYIVSARKYRPQTFDTVVGQEHITTTLKNAIRNQHLAHAYLFCGPRGVGKTTCARILAKTINCEHPTPDMEACGVCSNCTSFSSSSSFNIFELDAASNNSVDDIRELTNQVRFAPQQGKYKVYIIDEVHMLSAAAFNAFLKTLEEPPPYAIFILATTEKHKILPTILSRCQIFDFKRITTPDITAHLHSIATKEGVIAQEAALHVMAQKSEGCMRDALSMFDRIVSFTNGMLTYAGTMEHLNLLDADFYFKLTDYMLSQDVAGSLLLLDQYLEKGFEGDVIVGGLAEHMRNLLLCKDARMTRLLDVPNEHRSMYTEKANQTPPSFIISALNVLNDCELEYKNTTNKRLHVEMCLIRMCYLLQAVSNNDIKKNDSPVEAANGSQVTVSIVKPTETTANIISSDTLGVNNSAEKIGASGEEINSTITLDELSVNSYQHAISDVNSIVSEPAPGLNQQLPGSQNTPATGPGKSRRLSSDFVKNVHEQVSNNTAQAIESVVLTDEMAQPVFAKYLRKLQEEKQSVLHAQFISMKIQVLPPDEIRIICPSDMSETYAKNQRNILIDFFRDGTGVKVLRVTTEVQEDPEAIAAEQTTVLSKSEIYEVMAAKNPNIAKLKDALGLQIDY